MGHDRNAYLLKKYGITAVRYAEMSIEQGGACKCCHQIPTGKPLHVDHDHRIAATKISGRKVADNAWEAGVPEFGELFSSMISLAHAKELARSWLLAKSVRGLLCWKCNEGLRAFKNKAVILRSAAKYLDEFSLKIGELQNVCKVDVPGSLVR